MRIAAIGSLLLVVAVSACGDSGEPEPKVAADPACGDGVLDGDEQCDAGKDNSDTTADACRTTCERAHCGDGAADSGETCDDGNDVDTDACRNDCTAARCGDSVVQAGVEECDDGVLNSDIKPDVCRRDCTSPRCGDGIADTASGEACDDGNQADTDGCKSDCTQPTCGDGVVWDGHEECDDGASNSDSAPDACRANCREHVCGDGVADGGEQCDDANEDESDDCLIACKLPTCGDGVTWEGHEECDDGASNDDTSRDSCRTDCRNPYCGDGISDTGEACDDGNDVETDRCLSSCKVGSCGDGFLRAGLEQCDLGEDNSDEPGSLCHTNCKAPACHDGIVDDGEECDDGDKIDTDECVGTCVNATCGDGLLWKGVEACDLGDANEDVADTCRTTCQLPACGDGIADTGEACDDGAGNADDVADACRTSCALPTCGDAVMDTGEECDDGGKNSDDDADACRTTCVAAACGDKVLDSDEECDDGNAAEGDGCDASCAIEAASVPAEGETLTLTGTLDGTEKTFDRPDYDFYESYCYEPWDGESYYYDRFEVKNDSGSDQNVIVEAHWNGEGFLAVYVDGFDPDDPSGNCHSAGESYDWDLDYRDPAFGARSRLVSVPAGSRMTIVATSYSPNTDIGDYELIVDNASVGIGDVEPNGDTGSAVSYPSAHQTAYGSVDGGDEDWYAFDAVGGVRYRVEALSENANCYYDFNYFGSTVELYDGDGGYLDGNSSHAYYDNDWWGAYTGCSGLIVTPEKDGTYYVRVYPTYGDTLDPYYLLVRER